MMDEHVISLVRSPQADGAQGDCRTGRHPETKSFRGDFMLTFRFRRPSFEEVEQLAQRLLRVFPDDTFFIDRRIARVKNRSSEAAPEPANEGRAAA